MDLVGPHIKATTALGNYGYLIGIICPIIVQLELIYLLEIYL